MKKLLLLVIFLTSFVSSVFAWPGVVVVVGTQDPYQTCVNSCFATTYGYDAYYVCQDYCLQPQFGVVIVEGGYWFNGRFYVRRDFHPGFRGHGYDRHGHDRGHDRDHRGHR